jgi:hypothetical protein
MIYFYLFCFLYLVSIFVSLLVTIVRSPSSLLLKKNSVEVPSRVYLNASNEEQQNTKSREESKIKETEIIIKNLLGVGNYGEVRNI